MTLISKRRGCLPIALLVVAPFGILAAAWLYYSWRIPADSPLAQMYRTEVDLRALVTALETYRDAHGAYPPSGPEGMALAVEVLSGEPGYMPDGPPPDAWGRPFRYLAAGDYEGAGAQAFSDGDEYFVHSEFQLFSVGADGEAGYDDTAPQRDNINNWERHKGWRAHYHELQEAFTDAKSSAPQSND
jgi:hypothetical protein